MSYVPQHLEFNQRQIDGWPNGITEEGKAWATDRIKATLDAYRFVPLWLAVQAIFEAPDRHEDFKRKLGFNFRDATADRALRAAEGSEVWVTEKWHARRRFRFIGPGTITDPLTNDDAKAHFRKAFNPDRKAAERFDDWVDRGQVGDMFLLPAESITVFCSDQSVKPAS